MAVFAAGGAYAGNRRAAGHWQCSPWWCFTAWRIRRRMWSGGAAFVQIVFTVLTAWGWLGVNLVLRDLGFFDYRHSGRYAAAPELLREVLSAARAEDSAGVSRGNARACLGDGVCQSKLHAGVRAVPGEHAGLLFCGMDTFFMGRSGRWRWRSSSTCCGRCSTANCGGEEC